MYVCRSSVDFGLTEFAVSKHSRLIRSLVVARNRLSSRFSSKAPPEGRSMASHRAGVAFLRSIQGIFGRLDNLSLITVPSVYAALYREAQPILSFVRHDQGSHGLRVECDVIKRVRETLVHGRKAARLSSYRRRLNNELREAARYDRFVVFNTVTVRDRDYRKVFVKGSRFWNIFTEKVKGAVQDAAEDAGSMDTSYFAHFGVVEEGSETGRLHIHCVWVMSHLPPGCRDPNGGRGGVNREIDALRSLWRFGTSTPIAVRWANDPYSHLGWVWPSVRVKDLEGNFVLTPAVSSLERICSYLTKYITKPSKTSWRIRISHRFGLREITSRLQKLPLKTLIALASLWPPRLMPGFPLVRRAAVRLAALRIFQQSSATFSDHQMVNQFLLMLTPRESLFHRLKRLALNIPASTPASPGSLTLTSDPGSVSDALSFVGELREFYGERCDLVGSVFLE
jgi:hypothetical protein